MTDVFISYSRTDREVVKPLYDVLKSRKKDVWVDWEDIPPTAKWIEDIYAAIESADAIVFVISPDSVTSDVCAKELEHAASRNKRLIPMVCREIEATTVPETLKPLNWLFFAEKDIESTADTLIEVLETDLDWVKSHTRILTKAVEWEKKQQDSSLLLRGRDLQEAEDWLGGDSKAPHPTPLHGAYIAASRRLSNSRLRRLLVGICMTLIVTIGLGLYAYRLFLLADHRANLAESRQLSAQSKGLPIQDHDLSILLAVKAYQTHPTLEATAAVLNALARVPQLVCYFHGSGKEVRTVRFSPDGRTLASGCADSIIRLWDIHTRRSSESHKLEGHTDAVRALSFSSDGKVLVSGSDDSTIRLWDMSSMVALGQPLTKHEASVTAVALSPDGTLLASGDYGGKIRFWDVHSGRAVGPPNTSHGDFVASLVFSPDGQILASASDSSTIRLWDPHKFRDIVEPLTDHEAYVSSVAFRQDGSLMASDSYDNTVRLWSVANRRTVGAPLIGHQNEVQSVAFSPNGQLLASSGHDHKIILWDLETRSMRGTPLVNHDNVVESVAFSPDGSLLASAGWDGKTIMWKTDSGLCLESVLAGSAKPTDKPDDGQMDALWESRIGKKIISLWNVKQHAVETTLSFGPSQGITDLVFAPDGQTLFASSYDGNLKKWDLKQSPPEAHFISKDPFPVDKKEYIRRVGGDDRKALTAAIFNSPHNGIHSLALSSHGRYLAAGRHDQSVHLWDLARGDMALPPLTGYKEMVTDIAFHPTRSILVSSAGPRRWIWDYRDNRPMGTSLPTIDKSIRSMTFSPDGKFLAFCDFDDIIYLWDVDKNHLSEPVLTTKQTIDRIAFSPDNRFLASIGTDEDKKTRLQLWDLNRRLPVGPALLCQKVADELTFSPDGNILAVAGHGNVTLWDMDPNSWIRRSREMANRDLTPKERKRFLGE